MFISDYFYSYFIYFQLQTIQSTMLNLMKINLTAVTEHSTATAQYLVSLFRCIIKFSMPAGTPQLCHTEHVLQLENILLSRVGRQFPAH